MDDHIKRRVLFLTNDDFMLFDENEVYCILESIVKRGREKLSPEKVDRVYIQIYLKLFFYPLNIISDGQKVIESVRHTVDS